METPNKPHGWFFAFKCFVTGTDPKILATCPPRDLSNNNAIFYLQVGVWVWQVTLFSLVTHMMLAAPGQIRPELIAVSVLLATIIGLIDSRMVIAPSHYTHGLEELKRGGLVIKEPLALKIKSHAFLAVRFLIAGVQSVLLAMFVCLLLFAKDIGHQIDETYKEENTVLFAAAGARVDRDLAAIDGQRVQARNAIAAADDDASKLRQTATASPASPESKAIMDQLAALMTEQAAADAALVKAQTFSTNELAGVRGDPANSGVPGRGAVRRAAQERLWTAQRRVAAVKKDIAALQNRLHAVAGENDAEDRKHQSLVDVRLQQAQQSRQEAVARLASLDAEFERRTATREADIRASVESDPAHIKREDGLLGRAHALIQLTADRWVATIVILFDVGFFTIEMAAVLAKIMTFVPATYSTRLAEEDYLRAFETAHAVVDRMNNFGTAASSPSRDEDEPEGTDPAQTARINEPLPDPDEEAANDGLDPQFDKAARVARARAATKSKTNGTSASEQLPPADVPLLEEPAKRPRGRPPGSKTRPNGAEPSAPPWPEDDLGDEAA